MESRPATCGSLSCEGEGVGWTQPLDFPQHVEIAIDGNQKAHRTILHDSGMEGIACSQTVVSTSGRTNAAVTRSTATVYAPTRDSRSRVDY